MNDSTGGVPSWITALILGVIGVGIMASPFLSGNQNGMMVAFAFTVGAIFLVAALGAASKGVVIGEIVPFKRG